MLCQIIEFGRGFGILCDTMSGILDYHQQLVTAKLLILCLVISLTRKFVKVFFTYLHQKGSENIFSQSVTERDDATFSVISDERFCIHGFVCALLYSLSEQDFRKRSSKTTATSFVGRSVIQSTPTQSR